MQIISTKKFVSVFKDINMSSDRRFSFILGAGASKTSGIPTGYDLASSWFSEIQSIEPENDFDGWKSTNAIDEKELGTYYGVIYRKRFEIDPQSGYDSLSRIMEKAKPSFGYSVLAQILSTTHHNTVVTTNFDSLTEEALYTFSPKRALVCGHESLTGFAKQSLDRPLVAKIHRDLLLNPMNDPTDINVLADGWKTALDRIFNNSIPVIIGYGGNDGSLMSYFDSLNNLGNFFWCIRKGDEPSKKIKDIVEKHKGNFVEIEDFDSLMFDLWEGMGLHLLDKELEETAQKRADAYREAVNKIKESKQKSVEKEDRDAAKTLYQKSTSESELYYKLKADGAEENAKKKEILLEGMEKYPKSALLNNEMAWLLYLEKDTEADVYFNRALDLNPNNGAINCDYAVFLQKITREFDKARKYYKKALALEPENAIINNNYAVFLQDEMKEYNLAEKYYKKALTLNNEDVDSNSNYAIFLQDTRKDYEQAEKYHKKALSLDINNRRSNDNYATFLKITGNYAEAEKYYLAALRVEPENANTNANYAGLLLGLDRKDEAQPYLKKAFEKADMESIEVELWFYCYAHIIGDIYHAELKIVELLDKGVTSPGWDFSLNIQTAIKDGHPHPEKLQQYADRIVPASKNETAQ